MIDEIAEMLLCDKCLALHRADPYGENGTIVADFCARCREKMDRDLPRLVAERFKEDDENEERRNQLDSR